MGVTRAVTWLVAASVARADYLKAMSDDAAARAKARSTWPVRRFKLGEEPSEDLSSTTTPEERVAMMWQLAVDGWSISGRPFPSYTRATMPGALIRKK